MGGALGGKIMEPFLAAGLAFEASAIQSNMLKRIRAETEIKSQVPIRIFGNFINLSRPCFSHL